MKTIQIDLPLDLIHRLYGLAIAWNMTVDEVVIHILKKCIDKEEPFQSGVEQR